MFTNLLAGLLILSAVNSPTSNTVGIASNSAVDPIYFVAQKKDDDNDPGKDITDDPHGPGTHGPNPHGHDPYDEIHDNKLPANDPDQYLK